MFEATVSVQNPSGLHARPAAVFVQTASRFSADVRVANLTRDPDRSVNAKSILGVLTLGVSTGDRVRIVADGADAEDVVRALGDAVASGLGEATEL